MSWTRVECAGTPTSREAGHFGEPLSCPVPTSQHSGRQPRRRARLSRSGSLASGHLRTRAHRNVLCLRVHAPQPELPSRYLNIALIAPRQTIPPGLISRGSKRSQARCGGPIRTRFGAVIHHHCALALPGSQARRTGNCAGGSQSLVDWSARSASAVTSVMSVFLNGARVQARRIERSRVATWSHRSPSPLVTCHTLTGAL